MDYKNRIIEEAATLFRTYGIKTVTMDLLASNLGISKRTIYEVFGDKDELLIGVVQWMYEKQKEMMANILDESENVIVANFRMIDVMRDHFQNMSPSFLLDIKKYHHAVLFETQGKRRCLQKRY
jgi:AcrR family transcriptional regulator